MAALRLVFLKLVFFINFIVKKKKTVYLAVVGRERGRVFDDRQMNIKLISKRNNFLIICIYICMPNYFFLLFILCYIGEAIPSWCE